MTDDMDEQRTKWANRISALMAKATNDATPAEERQALLEKAMYLMSKYSIEETMLSFQQGVPEEIGHMVVRVTEPYALAKARILNSISKLLNCYVIRQLDHSKFSLFGYERDQLNTVLLYGSIVVQMFGEMAEAIKDKPKGMHGKTFNTSFLAGYAATIYERVNEIMARIRTEAKSTGNGMEVALVDQKNKLARAVRDMYPHISSHGANITIRHEGAYTSGRAAGARADLGQTRVSRQGNSNFAIGQ